MSVYGEEAVQKWMRQMPIQFSEWLEQEYTSNLSLLRGASDLLAVGRFQGILNVLDMLKELKKEA